MKNHKHLPLVSAAVVAIIWGGNFVVLNELTKYVGTFTIVSVQFSLCVLFLPFLKGNPPKLPYILLWGVFTGFLQYALQIAGMALGTPPGIASVILQLQVVFTPLLIFIAFKKKTSWYLFLLVITSLLGVYLISFNGSHIKSINIFAIVLLILASLSWAIGNLVIATLKNKQENYSMFSMVIYSASYISIPTLMIAYWVEGLSLNRIRDLSHNETIYVLIMLIWITFAYIGGYYIWNSLVKKHGGENIARYSLLVPIFGLLFSALAYGYSINLMQIIGIFIILLSLYIYYCLSEKQ